MQRANWKVFCVLAVMTAVGALATAWPSVAQQQPTDPAWRQPTKSKDAQTELQRAAEELAKLKSQIDQFKSIYATKAAELAAAQKAASQQPKTIEQRLTEIEAKLDILVAALGKKGPMGPPVSSPYGRPGIVVPTPAGGMVPPGMGVPTPDLAPVSPDAQGGAQPPPVKAKRE